MIKSLDEKTKDEFKRITEYVLAPGGWQVTDFYEPYTLFGKVKHGDEPWIKKDETVYPIVIKNNSSEEVLSIFSSYLEKDIKNAVWIVCHNFLYEYSMPERVKQEILEILYSEKIK